MVAVRDRGLEEGVVNFHLKTFLNRIATRVVFLDPKIYAGATGRICQVFLKEGPKAPREIFLPRNELLEKISRIEALPVDGIEKVAFKALYPCQYCSVAESGGRGSYNSPYAEAANFLSF